MHTERNAVCNLTPLEYVCGVAFSLVRLLFPSGQENAEGKHVHRSWTNMYLFTRVHFCPVIELLIWYVASCKFYRTKIKD